MMMKKLKVSSLEGAPLDWAVRWAKNGGPSNDYVKARDNFSTCWNKGGPIIERELIDLNYDIHWIRDLLDPEDNGDRWFASKAGQDESGHYGSTPLIAAMRCYVESKLGDEVEIPEELCPSA